MIRNIRTVVVREDKMGQFKAWAKSYVAYANDRWPTLNGQGFYQRFDVPEVTWYFMGDHADLAAFDAWLQETAADDGLNKLMEKMPADVLVEGGGGLVLLQSV